MERKIDMTANRTYFTPIRLFVFVLLMILLWMLLVPHAKAAAGIRRTVNFQGKLVNKADGTNITDGSYSFTFKFYDASSGGTQLPSGAAWSETQTLTVTNGIFRAELGSSTVIPTTMDFNADNIYLDITFNGETFGSRVRMTAVPYAFNAEKVGGLTVTSTTGTLTIPNGKTISFADAFTTSGANPLTLTTTGTTNATLPTGTITLVDLASTQTLTSKSIGSTGLTFSGATTDITTGTNEDFNIVANGTGKVGIGTTSPASFFDVNGKLNVLSGGNVGIGTTAPTVALEVRGSILVSGTATLNGNTTIGDANTDTLTINAGTSGTGITLADSSFANCTLKTVSNVVTCGTSGTFTSFTAAGDTGSNQSITDGNTLTIAGGTNGIDTVGTATDIVTLNLDTTEIGDATFGSGSGFTWTFDSTGGTDTTIAFGNNQQIFTAGTASFSNRLGIGTTAPTTALDVVGTFKLSGSATLSAYTGNGYIKTTGGTGTLSVGTTIPSSDVSGTLFTAAGDSGSGAIVQGNTLSILATGNGIDTSESGTTVTLTLDTTEIGSTTFGSGSAMTWTFDSTGGTDPTVAFGSNSVAFTAGTSTFSGNVGIGTTAPTALLDVKVDANKYIQLLADTNNPSITIQTNNGQPSIAINKGDGTNYSFMNLSNGLNFKVAGSTKLLLDTAGNFGIGTTSPTSLLSVGATSQFQVNSSGAIAAATGISSSGTIAFSGLSSNGYVKTTGGTGTLSVGTTIPSTDVSGTLFTAAGDSGSGAIVQGNTLSILATGNGIDTSESGTTVTLTLDTTEIGTTTFGSGSAMTWTFDSTSGTDTSIAFGNNQQIFTAGTASFSNRLGIGTTAPTTALDVNGGILVSGSATLNGNTAIGDANTDTLTINAGTSGNQINQ
ncbi:hypothetical protein HYS00_03360 [Candidatus Microgenomates bacterium]|nr:hypothetical protein [Candidatus Microgenomates bacterium]